LPGSTQLQREVASPLSGQCSSGVIEAGAGPGACSGNDRAKGHPAEQITVMVMSAVMMTLITACSISPPQSPQEAAANDATAERVYAALNADPIYFYRHVDVRVDRGVAHLSGYVWDIDALYKAKRIAAGVPGVTRVVNQMELERAGTRGGGHSGSG
jgi:BON domain